MTQDTPFNGSFEEFKSVILTVDAVSNPDNAGPYVQKFVASDQSLTEAVLSLLDYYDEQHLLSSPATIGQFQLAATAQYPGFVLRTDRNVEIILDASTFNRLCIEYGSVLTASKAILDLAGAAITDAEKQAGAAVPLLLLSFAEEVVHGHERLSSEREDEQFAAESEA